MRPVTSTRKLAAAAVLTAGLTVSPAVAADASPSAKSTPSAKGAPSRYDALPTAHPKAKRFTTPKTGDLKVGKVRTLVRTASDDGPLPGPIADGTNEGVQTKLSLVAGGYLGGAGNLPLTVRADAGLAQTWIERSDGRGHVSFEADFTPGTYLGHSGTAAGGISGRGPIWFVQNSWGGLEFAAEPGTCLAPVDDAMTGDRLLRARPCAQGPDQVFNPLPAAPDPGPLPVVTQTPAGAVQLFTQGIYPSYTGKKIAIADVGDTSAYGLGGGGNGQDGSDATGWYLPLDSGNGTAFKPVNRFATQWLVHREGGLSVSLESVVRPGHYLGKGQDGPTVTKTKTLWTFDGPDNGDHLMIGDVCLTQKTGAEFGRLVLQGGCDYHEKGVNTGSRAYKVLDATTGNPVDVPLPPPVPRVEMTVTRGGNAGQKVASTPVLGKDHANGGDKVSAMTTSGTATRWLVRTATAPNGRHGYSFEAEANPGRFLEQDLGLITSDTSPNHDVAIMTGRDENVWVPRDNVTTDAQLVDLTALTTMSYMRIDPPTDERPPKYFDRTHPGCMTYKDGAFWTTNQFAGQTLCDEGGNASFNVTYTANGAPIPATDRAQPAASPTQLVRGNTVGGGDPLCLDVDHGGTANGTAVQQWGCNQSPPQTWTLPAKDYGSYAAMFNDLMVQKKMPLDDSDRAAQFAKWEVFAPAAPVRALGKCLDVGSGGTADGAKVQLWDCDGSPRQLWHVERPVSSLLVQAPGVKLVNPNSHKCVQIESFNLDWGLRAQIQTCNAFTDQNWSGTDR